MTRNGFLSALVLFSAGFFGAAVTLAQNRSLSSPTEAGQGPSLSGESARPQNPSGTGGKGRRATLNFEDELVQGTNQKPDMVYLFQQKKFNYNRLIKLRENFKPEMRETVEDVQRIRSEN